MSPSKNDYSNEQVITEGIAPETPRVRHITTIIAWIILLLVVVGGYVWESRVMSHPNPASAVANTPPTFLLVNVTNAKQATYLYLINAVTGALQHAKVQVTTPSVAVDNKSLIGVADQAANAGSPGGVYEYPRGTTNLTLIAKATQNVPFVPQLSPDNSRVAFDELATSSKPLDYDTLISPSSWHIYLASSGGPARMIAKGLYPHWSPDGKTILYLANDGLHVFSVASSTDSLIWPVKGTGATGQTIFTVSKDGKMIAWMNPVGDQVLIGSIATWSPFVLQSSYTLSARGSWPVFSPDDTKLAFEQFDWLNTSSTEQVNRHIVVMDLTTHDLRTVFDLSNYSPDMSMTDWMTQ